MAKVYNLEVSGRYNDKLNITDGISLLRVDEIHIIKDGEELLKSNQLASHLVNSYTKNKIYSKKLVEEAELIRKVKVDLSIKTPFFVKIKGEHHLYLNVTSDSFQTITCANSIKDNAVIKVGIVKEFGFCILIEHQSIDQYLGIEDAVREFQWVLSNSRGYSLEECRETMDNILKMQSKINKSIDLRDDYLKNDHVEFENNRKRIISYINDDFKGSL